MLPLPLAESLVQEWSGVKVSLSAPESAIALAARPLSWAVPDADHSGRQLPASQAGLHARHTQVARWSCLRVSMCSVHLHSSMCV